MTINIQNTLRNEYHDLTKKNGLINFLEDLRQPEEKYSVRKNDLQTLFENLLNWRRCSQSSGHIRFDSVLTGISVSWQNHGDTTINPGHAVELRETVQRHVNIIGDAIFGYRLRNWKSEPDYAASARRYAVLYTRNG